MADRPRDGFEQYFAEKLWELIPEAYRHEDGLAENPGVLRSLVEIWATQAAILRRSQDRLWEDEFIERCDDWAVSYLGDLVGTHLVSALNQRGRRIDVAKTIYYRRRKGTVRVLEELISDIAGWDGRIVEQFRHLGRTRHRLDPQPTALAGRFSGTLPGGWADLRQPQVAELADSPFSEFHYTADVRQHRGSTGRYNIPKLAVHLYRLIAFRVAEVTPHAISPTELTFDPAGREIPLFSPRNRLPDWEEWRSAQEWELPLPIRCRLLGHAEYVISEALIQQLVADPAVGLSNGAADELRSLRGWRFRSESQLRQTLTSLSSSAELLNAIVYLPLLAGGLIPDCGKAALLAPALAASPIAVQVQVGSDPVPVEQTIAANLQGGTIAVANQQLAIDPEHGRFRFLDAAPAEPVTVTYHYGFSAAIGAGTYDRAGVESRTPDTVIPAGGGSVDTSTFADGVVQVEDSATYELTGTTTSITQLTVQSANQQRPYLRLESDWEVDSTPNEDAVLLLDGLWLGSRDSHSVILRGDYETVTLRFCTLDPGGVDATGTTLTPVHLIVVGQVETLEIEASILATIRTQDGGVIEQLTIRDSILQSLDATPAIALADSDVQLSHVTVFGGVDVNRLYASEALISDLVDVTDTQNGCFRFSAAPAGSRLPRPYQSHVLVDAAHLFTSRRFGYPGYAQLSQTAPVELQRGAENGSEIGALNRLLNPIKLDSLAGKIEEYMPFGLIPIYILET